MQILTKQIRLYFRKRKKSKMRIVYVPLEPYQERYTLQLADWNIKEFERLGLEYIYVNGENIDASKKINTGIILDVYQRSYWALSQVMNLITMAREGIFREDDVIFFEDMFHPGIEALAYVKDITSLNVPLRPFSAIPPIVVRCLAQTIDPDDFVHYTNMSRWMRHYEHMVNQFVDLVLVASEEMIPFMTAAGWDVPISVTGLPFGKKNVQEFTPAPIKLFKDRCRRVLFTSRIADEKQPEFFIEVAKEYKKDLKDDTVFAFVSGGKISHPAIDLAVLAGIVEVYPYRTKAQYYDLLKDSRLVFNCALQDWVSNTVSEADALGCNVLFPAYRSFPEVFKNDQYRLYIPWSVKDAARKTYFLLSSASEKIGEISDYQDRSIARTIEAIDKNVFNFNVNSLAPHDTRYRKNIINRVLRERGV